MKHHQYKSKIVWTGNTGESTKNHRSYQRSYTISVDGKADILGSSDPAFLGNPALHNPEDLLLASVSSCHLLWYLHLCSVNKILVLEYEDFAEGTMMENENGSGKFSEIILKPRIVVAEKEMIEKAFELHNKANEYCFIANSLNFEVKHQPEITTK
ncbi:OsmC family protein [Epilithonimonas arachidiradicis]|uniref:Organic hydroperoxide reductase OsmC/OhrA n=1 Tax=Epilithonimonas arachidiradicis TaxID=1617282 RepID=A0A420CXP1_9FLAO|nr:OsmC family protein [Epilithonimonas arachidiradicis]RKE83197.1 organic hydroperoxide reductase OsmC/OhrA [Epilithonimonas arachidiradicis]GGG65611.1 peroxiredoxin [Epilithonimonas arachidiradicis]